jgi:hypothetical protein
MGKDVVVQFDADAYKEYKELQEAVAYGKRTSEKPTYEQLLTSINNAIKKR